jgi:glycogen synthase
VRVLRLCSVFEVPPVALSGRGAHFDPVGGMQNHTAELTRRLDGMGVSQTVLTTRPPPAPADHAFGDHAHVIRVGLPIPSFRQMWSIPALGLVPGLARTADLIHAHLAEDLAIVPLARIAARHGLPLVVTVHISLRHTLRVTNLRSAVLETVGGSLQRWGVRSAAAVITLTPRSARLLERDGVDPRKLHVIPSGVDRSLFEGVHDDPFPQLSRPRVVFLGRLVLQKGVVELVRAAARLRTPGLQVLLVGDGPARVQLEREIRTLGLTGRVHVTGFLPHDRIGAVLAHTDLFVLPSWYEELGSALLEAMCAGLPIVASDVGGIPDVIDDGETGVLVPPGDAAALAAAIDGLFSDPARARLLAKRARAASSHYDWAVLSRSVAGIYRSLIPSGTRSTYPSESL